MALDGVAIEHLVTSFTIHGNARELTEITPTVVSSELLASIEDSQVAIRCESCDES